MHKRTALLILIGVLMASCGVRKTTAPPDKKITGIGQDIINFGMRYLNKPYRFAGKGPHAFDCSGFTSFVFREFGYRLSSSSAGQDRQLPSIMQREHLQVGDLVFFEGRAHNGQVGHVGIVKELLPNGEFRFLHASTASGVIVSHSAEPYYASRYLRGGRVLKENNALVAAKRIPKEKTKEEKRIDKRKNGFNPAKANEQVLIEAPKAKADKSQILDQPVREKQTLAVHTRPLSQPESGPTPKNPEREGRIPPTIKTIILPDTISVPEPAESNLSADGSSLQHLVEPGETLYSISRKYECTVAQLKEWNPHLGAVLRRGEKLLIRP